MVVDRTSVRDSHGRRTARNLATYGVLLVGLHGTLAAVGLASGASGAPALIGSFGLAIAQALPGAFLTSAAVTRLPQVAGRRSEVGGRRRTRSIAVLVSGVIAYVSIVAVQAATVSSSGPGAFRPDYASLTYAYTFVPTVTGVLFGSVARLRAEVSDQRA